MPEGLHINMQPKSNPDEKRDDFFDLHTSKIETENNFWNIYIDAKNYLTALENFAKDPNLPDHDFMALLNEFKDEFLHFKEYLKKAEIILPDSFSINPEVVKLIRLYDATVDKLKNSASRESFLEAVKYSEQIPNKGYDLGVYGKDEN